MENLDQFLANQVGKWYVSSVSVIWSSVVAANDLGAENC